MLPNLLAWILVGSESLVVWKAPAGSPAECSEATFRKRLCESLGGIGFKRLEVDIEDVRGLEVEIAIDANDVAVDHPHFHASDCDDAMERILEFLSINLETDMLEPDPGFCLPPPPSPQPRFQLRFAMSAAASIKDLEPWRVTLGGVRSSLGLAILDRRRPRTKGRVDVVGAYWTGGHYTAGESPDLGVAFSSWDLGLRGCAVFVILHGLEASSCGLVLAGQVVDEGTGDWPSSTHDLLGAHVAVTGGAEMGLTWWPRRGPIGILVMGGAGVTKTDGRLEAQLAPSNTNMFHGWALLGVDFRIPLERFLEKS
ncbi:hypothetical protein ACNOYE_26990 [Nannocystaceae bacterium ST9]